MLTILQSFHHESCMRMKKYLNFVLKVIEGVKKNISNQYGSHITMIHVQPTPATNFEHTVLAKREVKSNVL